MLVRGRLWHRLQLKLVQHYSRHRVSLQVQQASAMVDEKVSISVDHLEPHQVVTLHAELEESGMKFQSSAVYKADQRGSVDVTTDHATSGSYTGRHQMGLFWAIKPSPGQGEGLRLMKKDVSTPLKLNVKLLKGAIDTESENIDSENILAQSNVERWYLKPGVRRIPVTEGPYRGTLFVPEGAGPFPGVVDMFGGLISLIETRAALLASKGYATFALSYLITDHLPKYLLQADPGYVVEACQWFSQLPFVIKDRIGAVAVCFGGTMALFAASRLPQLQAVVAINALSFYPHSLNSGAWPKSTGENIKWPSSNLVYKTSEGVVIQDIYKVSDPYFIPAWQHGGKVLCLIGEDDQQYNPEFHRQYESVWPESHRHNLETHYYPGAGHLIEPPYIPYCRVVNPSRKRMESLQFIPSHWCDELLMAGGYPEEHAAAQEDGWSRTLDFLNNHLR